MTTNEPEEITTKDKIHILLKEYDTLRAEILNRINQRWQMIGLVGGILTFLSTQTGKLTGWLLSGYVVALALVLLWLKSGEYVARLGARLTELETRVNALAGDKLLEWETIGRTRLIRRFFRQA